jgi:hypothetical protein
VRNARRADPDPRQDGTKILAELGKTRPRFAVTAGIGRPEIPLLLEPDVPEQDVPRPRKRRRPVRPLHAAGVVEMGVRQQDRADLSRRRTGPLQAGRQFGLFGTDCETHAGIDQVEDWIFRHAVCASAGDSSDGARASARGDSPFS